MAALLAEWPAPQAPAARAAAEDQLAADRVAAARAAVAARAVAEDRTAEDQAADRRERRRQQRGQRRRQRRRERRGQWWGQRRGQWRRQRRRQSLAFARRPNSRSRRAPFGARSQALRSTFRLWGRSTSTQPLALKHQKGSRRYRSKKPLIARGGICSLADTAGVSLATTLRLHIWLDCGVNGAEHFAGGMNAWRMEARLTGVRTAGTFNLQLDQRERRTVSRCLLACRSPLIETVGDTTRSPASRRIASRELGARPDSVWTARGFETGALRSPWRALLCCGRCRSAPTLPSRPQGRAAGIVEIPVLA